MPLAARELFERIVVPRLGKDDGVSQGLGFAIALTQGLADFFAEPKNAHRNPTQAFCCMAPRTAVMMHAGTM